MLRLRETPQSQSLSAFPLPSVDHGCVAKRLLPNRFLVTKRPLETKSKGCNGLPLWNLEIRPPVCNQLPCNAFCPHSVPAPFLHHHGSIAGGLGNGRKVWSHGNFCRQALINCSGTSTRSQNQPAIRSHGSLRKLEARHSLLPAPTSRATSYGRQMVHRRAQFLCGI